MNELEYKSFYDKVGRLNGWDFSKIKCETVGDTWDFYSEVKKGVNHHIFYLMLVQAEEKMYLT